MSFALALAAGSSQAAPAFELTTEAEFIEGATEGSPERVWFYGQSPEKGVIPLTATNGFFHHSFVAIHREVIPVDGVSPALRGLTKGNRYGALRATNNPSNQPDARWHLWLNEAAPIQAEVFMIVPEGEADRSWTFELGEEKFEVKSKVSDGSQAMATLSFQPKERGRMQFSMTCAEETAPAETEILWIRLTGPGIDQAKLLRARYVLVPQHGKFTSGAPRPTLWVFESRAADHEFSFSPLSTLFGYYGAVFRGGRARENSGFNFSMWIAGKGATEAPPVERCARLIATGIPEATFDYFGHEGTGVKLRNAVAYPNGADRIIQAMRTEFDQETGLITFTAYFYQPEEQRWILYGCGQKPPQWQSQIKGMVENGFPGLGCFIENPREPHIGRNGDTHTTILRRGWFYGEDGAWYPATYQPIANLEEQWDQALAKANAGNLPRFVDGKWTGPPYTNQRWTYHTDEEGKQWHKMSSGGMEFYPKLQDVDATAIAGRDSPPAASTAALPDYLQPDKAQALFVGPVDFGAPTVQAQSTSATVNYPLVKTGSNSQAVLWYGPTDCATFVLQEQAHGTARGSAAYQDLMSPERTWAHSTESQPVAKRDNTFELSELEPNTTYYFRLYVEHDEGKSWDYTSGSFTTSE